MNITLVILVLFGFGTLYPVYRAWNLVQKPKAELEALRKEFQGQRNPPQIIVDCQLSSRFFRIFWVFLVNGLYGACLWFIPEERLWLSLGAVLLIIIENYVIGGIAEAKHRRYGRELVYARIT